MQTPTSTPSETIRFFTEQAHARPSEIKQIPVFAKRVDELRQHLPDIGPDQFQKLPDWVQVEVFKTPFESSCEIYPFVKGKQSETVAFIIPDFRPSIIAGACQWNEDRTALTISSSKLTAEQIALILAEVADKNQVDALDLAGCAELTSLSLNDQSILEGFSQLTQLTLPRNTFFEDLTGIECLKESLKSLDLSESGVETLENLEGFHQLSHISCANCGKLKDIDGLNDSGLKILTLTSCSQVSWEKLRKTLATLTHLHEGDFSGTQLRELSPFKNMRDLNKVTVPAAATGSLDDNIEVIRS